jgi:hypothetical protein
LKGLSFSWSTSSSIVSFSAPSELKRRFLNRATTQRSTKSTPDSAFALSLGL